MPTGAKKISQLPALTRNDSEIIPVVQDDGLGNLTTGTLPIADLGTDTNIYNTDGTLTGNRTVTQAGNSLTFLGTTNGVVVESASTTRSLYGLNTGNGIGVLGVGGVEDGVRGESNSGAGVSGLSNTSYGGEFIGASGILGQGTTYGVVGVSVGSGVYAYSTGSGYGVVPYENTGSAGALNCQGKALFNGTAATGSSLVQIDSTTQGVLLPRMTTTQRNAIASPATGLEIYNTTTNRKEVYNGTFWQGISMRFLQIQHAAWSPVDAQTVAFGVLPLIPVTATISPAPYEIVMRGNGVIRGCDFESYASGVAGTNESWSLYVRHQGTDYLVQTVSASAAVRKFSNTSLNIPYVSGDIVRMVFVNPTWATNPTLVGGGGFLTLQ
jgi:hypothetical protein